MSDVSAQAVRILIVDDHALFRESVARFLNAEPDMKVVAHGGSIEEALSVLRHQEVDIVLLDFDLGIRNGLEFMQMLRRQGFGGRVLIVTAKVGKLQAADLIRSGVSGIFLKRSSAASLAAEIRDVIAGKASFDQDLLREAVSDASPSDMTRRLFTQREREVLSSVFEGMANKEIAARFGLSESSVKATLQQLFAKTGVRTRSQLVRIVLEQYKSEL